MNVYLVTPKSALSEYIGGLKKRRQPLSPGARAACPQGAIEPLTSKALANTKAKYIERFFTPLGRLFAPQKKCRRALINIPLPHIKHLPLSILLCNGIPLGGFALRVSPPLRKRKAMPFYL
jgi:hypothetical protein